MPSGYWEDHDSYDDFEHDDDDDEFMDAEERHEEMMATLDETRDLAESSIDRDDLDDAFETYNPRFAGDSDSLEDAGDDGDDDDHDDVMANPLAASYGHRNPDLIDLEAWADDDDAPDEDAIHDDIEAPSLASRLGLDDELDFEPDDNGNAPGDDDDDGLDGIRAAIQRFNPSGDPDWGVPDDVLADPDWEASGRDQTEYWRAKGYDMTAWDEGLAMGDDDGDDDDDDDDGGGGFFSRVRGFFGGGSGDDDHADEREGSYDEDIDAFDRVGYDTRNDDDELDSGDGYSLPYHEGMDESEFDEADELERNFAESPDSYDDDERDDWSMGSDALDENDGPDAELQDEANESTIEHHDAEAEKDTENEFGSDSPDADTGEGGDVGGLNLW